MVSVRLDRGTGLYVAIGSWYKMSLKKPISKTLGNQEFEYAQVQACLSQLPLELHNLLGEVVSSQSLVDRLVAPIVFFIAVIIIIPWRPGPWRPSVRVLITNQDRRISLKRAFSLGFGVFCIRKSYQQSLHDRLVSLSDRFFFKVLLLIVSGKSKHKDKLNYFGRKTKFWLVKP